MNWILKLYLSRTDNFSVNVFVFFGSNAVVELKLVPRHMRLQFSLNMYLESVLKLRWKIVSLSDLLHNLGDCFILKDLYLQSLVLELQF